MVLLFWWSNTFATIDRYVIYNYRDDIWYYGQLNRTTWVDAGVNQYALATSGGTYTHMRMVLMMDNL